MPKANQLENDNFSIKRQNLRTAALVIGTLTYLLFGAVTFDKLESPTEEVAKKTLVDAIIRFKEKFNMSDDVFEEFYKHLIKKKVLMRDAQWDFNGSFFFCVLAVTLIGYGHSTPQTFKGRLILLLYLPGGLFLSAVSLQAVGKKINEILRSSMTFLKRKNYFYSFKTVSVTSFDLIIVEFFLTVLLILGASYIFSIMEGWTYFEGIYYSFITFTTIGFGDFVPLQKNKYMKTKTSYLVFTILFITTGLVIVASAFNLLVVYFVNINKNIVENLRRRMEEKKRLESQKMLTGDVIKASNKQDVVTCIDEAPETYGFDDALSNVCSCEDINQCFKLGKFKVKKEIKRKQKSIKNSAYTSIDLDDLNWKFSIRQKPVNSVKHLSLHFDKTDLILPSEIDRTNNEIKKLAIESDFIQHRKITRRNSS